MIETFTIGGFATNTYVISNKDNECILVDPGLGFSSLYKYINDKYDVKAILLTHGHLDHIDGVRYYLDKPIYIHKLDEEFLYDGDLSLYSMVGMRNPFSKGMLNVITVLDGFTFNIIGLDVKVMHTPGHTRGSVCYYIDGKLFTGDTLFNGSCGRTDFPTGSISDMGKSLKRIVESYSNSCICYPGHEHRTTIGNEKSFNPFIVGL